MKVSVRLSSVRPTSLASSMSLSSVRRVRNSLRASAATSPFEATRFALKRLQALDSAAHLVDQALFLKRIEVNAANLDGNLDARARHRPLRLHVRLFLGLGRGLQLFGLLQRQVVQLRNFVDVLQRLLCFVSDFFFGQLFVVKLDDLFDGPRTF